MRASGRRGLRGQRGLALVLTLVVLAIITAMVVEFAYGVYVHTNFLHNWQASEQLSLAAESGVRLAAELIGYASRQYPYTHPGKVTVPPSSPFTAQEGDAPGATVALTIEDETSKFNLNSLVHANDQLNDKYAYPIFKRLLENLSVDEDVADRIVDWIDRNEVPRLTGTEDGAKNMPLESVEELLLIPGIDREVYDTVEPYVTVFGGARININGAELPLLTALHEEMTEELAQRIVSRRELQPFEKIEQLQSVVGFEKGLGTSLIGRIAVKGEVFRVISNATAETGIRRSVECVMDASGKVSYWKEI